MLFRYYTENDDSIGGECPKCDRVMQVRRQFNKEHSAGYSFTQPVSCKCGMQFDGIDGKKQIRVTSATPATDGSVGLGAGLLVIFLGTAIWAFDVISCDGPEEVVVAGAERRVAALEPSVEQQLHRESEFFRPSTPVPPIGDSDTPGDVGTHQYCDQLANIGLGAFQAKQGGSPLENALAVARIGLQGDVRKQTMAQGVIIAIYGDSSITSGAKAYDVVYSSCMR